MDSKETKERIASERETAFGALVVLLAESIPLGKSEIIEEEGRTNYILSFPWATLMYQASKSLAKLVETADAVMIWDSEGIVKFTFSLRHGA